MMELILDGMVIISGNAKIVGRWGWVQYSILRSDMGLKAGS